MDKYKSIRDNSVLVNVEQFNDYGGWVLDTQFMLNMGSPYLLAHGLGKPVKDAVTKVSFPKNGEYNLWVYTRDWVAGWKEGIAPGVFEVNINGAKVDAVFGNQGVAWHWQYGGKVDIQDSCAKLSLHDLTGFEGRCASIFFTTQLDFVPPNQQEELTVFRRSINRKTEESFAGKFDIVVAGGGIAGICCALSAARNGLKTAFVQDRPVVGGNNSSEVRVWLGGETNFEPYPGIGKIVNELEQEKKAHYGCSNIGDIYEDDKKLDLLKNEENITLFMQHILLDARTENDIIKSVLLYDVVAGDYKVLEAYLFTDATGDASLGYAAGADYEVTTNGHMGMTNFWCVKDRGVLKEFPRCPWAIDLSNVSFPGRKDIKDVYSKSREISLGCWFWESGTEHDPIEMAEYARDTNFRAMYGAWDCLKNFDEDYKTYELYHSSYIGGKRESRRLLGEVLLTKSDVIKSVEFDDRCVPSTWSFDVHYPDRRFYSAFHEGDGFITKDYHEKFNTPYFIPYRCLYSRNIKNLFMAGRNVSVTHDALGTVRVMRTGGMMGEVVGIAAAICIKNNALPGDVYQEYLKEFKEALLVT